MNEQQVSIPLKQIKPNPYQPRLDEDRAIIEEIAINIFRNGLMQVPSARAVNGHYELVFGHTRLAAYELLATEGVKEADIAADNRFAEMPLIVRELSDRQMFEMAIAENIKRRDLNAIEQAGAMKRYMDDFTATSKEAAELFGVNDATVRGKVRLLDLPAEAQQKLADGAISEGTARALLSMQRVAPAEAVAKAIKQIEREKENSVPDEVIERSMSHLPNVVEMWEDDRRKGKPRSSWNNGWLLEMKNFPNHLLPALSDKNVDAAKTEHLLNPPACTACPFYTKVHGTHFCGVKACHDRKTIAWHESMIQQSSKNLGIAIYEPSDGRYVILESYTSAHQALVSTKHKGLRLLRTPTNGHHYQNYQGIDDDFALLVATGDAIAKLGSRNNSTQNVGGGKMTDKEKAERRAMKIFRVRRKELMWEYAGVAQSMFAGVPEKVIEQFCRWRNILMDDAIPEEYKRGNAPGEYARRKLVWTMIMGDCSHYRRQAMATIVKAFEIRTGVKPGKALLKHAQEWDSEIADAAKVKSVSTATKGKKA